MSPSEPGARYSARESWDFNLASQFHFRNLVSLTVQFPRKIPYSFSNSPPLLWILIRIVEITVS